MILSTMDYDIFKKHEANRTTDKNNLKKLVTSLSKRNLLALRPILVNKEMEIIDGQHRLLAAKSLQIPIFYQIQDDSETNDIITLNANQRRWIMTDYLNYFVHQNLEEYIKIDNYMKKNKLSLNTCLTLFNQGGGTYFAAFRIGKYKFPENMDTIEERLLQIHAVQSFLHQKLIGDKKYIYFPTFVKALVGFLNSKEIEFETFMKKIEYKLDWMRHCTRFIDYFDIFRQIYNYKNTNPLLQKTITDIVKKNQKKY